MRQKNEQTAIVSEELLCRAKRGDRDALTELYEATNQDVYRAIHAMIRDEDLVLDVQQDTYLRAFERLDQLKKAESFHAWIRRIAVNEAKNQLSRKKPLLFSELTDAEAPEAYASELSELPEDALNRAETARLVDEILQTLTPEQQLVVGMYYYEQIPTREIAQTLGVSPGTVQSQLYWGRKKIESGVRALEKRGVKLYGLAPVPFLMGLLKNSTPIRRKSRRVFTKVLKSGVRSAASGGIVVGRTFGETALGKLAIGLLTVSILGGGALGVGALAELNASEPMGDYRPPVLETAPAQTEPAKLTVRSVTPTHGKAAAELELPDLFAPTEPTEEAPTEAPKPPQKEPAPSESEQDQPKRETPPPSEPAPTEPAPTEPEPTEPSQEQDEQPAASPDAPDEEYVATPADAPPVPEYVATPADAPPIETEETEPTETSSP